MAYYRENRFLLPSIILAVAFVLAVLIFAMNWRSIRRDNQTVTVTGSAKKELTSDLGILRGTLTSFSPSIQDAYREIQSQKPALLEYLAKNGFPADKVEFQTLNNYPQYSSSYRNDREMMATTQPMIVGYNANQSFHVESNDVKKIQQLSLDITSLIEKGVNLNIMPPEYYYTKLADLKIAIQSEAARDAMIRGEQIAKATDRKLGPLKSAKMGVLQITPKNSNMISDYGVNDVSSIEKELTAVVNATFEIE